MSLADEAGALAASGRIAEAVQRLRQSGDGGALLALAIWTLTGRHVTRDLPAARELFHQAAQAGDATAIGVHTCLLANGAGGRPDWPAALAHLAIRTDAAAARMRQVLAAMALRDDGSPSVPPVPEPICARPTVLLFRSLLSPLECDYLREIATPLLEPSVVIDSRTGRSIRDPVRTSDTAAFPFVSEDPVVHALNRRFAAATRTQVDQGEPLQVLRYDPGQQFHPHTDALAGDANPRVWTVLTWLNTQYEGGRTHFITPDLRIRGGQGDAIAFRSADASGRADPASRHAGEPVTRGTKFLASRWIRARRLTV
ncbi:2OG-Fe(II) oxygenase [Glacieibacterium sp.]|uniref:2OG-Fe(II) oxygenase n=1 Tax=Glacieibacterium sp. TaxID=2860237 RepID=UPI003B001A6D